MKFHVGDLVQYVQDVSRLAIVTMTHVTFTGAEVCEVVIVYDDACPDSVGEKRYSNQDYWKHVGRQPRPLDKAIAGLVDEYEEALELHKTYGES